MDNQRFSRTKTYRPSLNSFKLKFFTIFSCALILFLYLLFLYSFENSNNYKTRIENYKLCGIENFTIGRPTKYIENIDENSEEKIKNLFLKSKWISQKNDSDCAPYAYLQFENNFLIGIIDVEDSFIEIKIKKDKFLLKGYNKDNLIELLKNYSLN